MLLLLTAFEHSIVHLRPQKANMDLYISCDISAFLLLFQLKITNM
jgi:hypothetical protein